MEVTVLLAAPRPFCAGVERAVATIEEALRRYGPPVYVRRRVVHNDHVIAGLQARGAIVVHELDQVPAGAVVVFGAHGVAPAVYAEAGRRGLHVIDATCPLVTRLHGETRRLAARGDTVLLLGHAGHDEVQGILGQVPGGVQLVQDLASVDDVLVEDPRRVSYLVQTTLAADETGEIADELRARFPEVSGPGPGDLCGAATARHEAVAAVAGACDLVLIAGPPGSPDADRIADVARRHGAPARIVADVRELRPERLDGARTIGLTAATSAPPGLVDEMIAVLGPARVTAVTTVMPSRQAVGGTPAGSSRVPV